MEPKPPRPITKILIAAIVVTIILIIFTTVFRTQVQRVFRGITPTPIGPSPTVATRRVFPTLPPAQIQLNNQLKEQLQGLPILSTDQTSRMRAFVAKLPLRTPDYQIGFSDTTRFIYVYEITPGAAAQLNALYQENNVLDLIQQYGIFFKIVAKPIDQAILEAEEAYFQEKEEHRLLGEPNVQGLFDTRAQEPPAETIDPDEPIMPDQNDIGAGIDMLQGLIRFGGDDPLLGSAPGAGGGGGPSGTIDPNTDLAKIFNEINGKIGIPARILQLILSMECGRLLDPAITPNEKIVEWSTPGQGLPTDHYCYKNRVGALGPFQFMPGTWYGNFDNGYGKTINDYGYFHAPLFNNIRDSAYAAARYLMKYSEAAPNTGWTYDQMVRAIIGYNCGPGCLDTPVDQQPGETQNYIKTVWERYQSGT